MGSQKDAHISHMESFDAGYVKGLTDAILIAEDCDEGCSHCFEISRVIRKKLSAAMIKEERTEDPNQLKLPL